MAGVLLDTGFLIALSKPDDRHHAFAREYWKYFLTTKMPIYLSVIVVAEFSIIMEIPDEILRCCIVLPFSYRDAVRSGKFDLLKMRKDEEKGEVGKRDSLKDDMKIIAHAAGESGVKYVITRDPNSFIKYAETMRQEGQVNFSIIDLSEGFTLAHFSGGQYSMFDLPITE